MVYGITPTTKTLIKIADYFNVSLCYLLGRTNENDYIKPSNSTSFQSRFEELRKEKGVTTCKVCTDCFIGVSCPNGWFKKGYLPILEILDMLSQYFNVSLDYLLGRSDYRT